MASSTIAPSAYQIEQVMSAYQRALADLQRLNPTGGEINDSDSGSFLDLDAASDNVEDLVQRLIRSMLEAEMMDNAVQEYIERLTARRDRWGRWAERSKELAAEILEIVGWPTPIRYPDFTLSKGSSLPAIKITDANLLPDEFCKITRTPRLMEIRRAIEAGQDVPGTELGNPHTYLKVLRR